MSDTLTQELTPSGAPAPAAEEPKSNRRSLAERLLWALAGLTLINWSVQLLGAATSFAWVGVLVVLCGFWGLGTVLSASLPNVMSGSTGKAGRWLGWATVLLTIGMFIAWAYVQVRNSPSYGTDELAFDQYAAMLVREGMNPYVHSMAPAFSMFQVSPDGYSYTLAGHAVTQLSYPSLSFEVYLPLLILGIHTQAGVIMNVFAWALTVGLMYGILPARLRPLAILVGSVGIYTSFSVGGVTDALYMPLLVVAAYRWDRFGNSWKTYIGPVALGLAMSIKQTPWLLALFVVVALWCDTRLAENVQAASRRALKYLGVVFLAFLVPNIPFLLMNPHAWFNGVLTPLVSQLVPAGQGTIGLALYSGIGGGSLSAFTVAMGLLALLVLGIQISAHPLLKPATFVLPSLVLFFASRSYSNYLVSLVPAMIVAMTSLEHASAATVARAHSVRWQERLAPWVQARLRLWLGALGALTAAFIVSVIYALTAAPALALKIAGIRTTGQLETIQQVSLTVTNHSSHTVTPAFTLNEGGEVTTFWEISKGPSSLSAHTTASYTLVAPNYQAQPPISGGFSVMAFTRSPATVATSGPYVPSALHVALIPAAVNTPVPVGQKVVVEAQLYNSMNRPVHRANVPVYLGQVIYDQGGLGIGEAVINNSEPGATPVRAYTGPDGIATFTISDTATGTVPTFFEANLVSASDFFPYGYSNLLPIRFGNL